MIAAITITIKSAVLLFVSATAQAPEQYCVVSDSMSGQESMYRNPEGGCKALGRAIESDIKEQFPSVPVILVVDGVSTNDV